MTNPTKAPQEKNLFVPAVDYPDDIFAQQTPDESQELGDGPRFNTLAKGYRTRAEIYERIFPDEETMSLRIDGPRGAGCFMSYRNDGGIRIGTGPLNTEIAGSSVLGLYSEGGTNQKHLSTSYYEYNMGGTEGKGTALSIIATGDVIEECVGGQHSIKATKILITATDQLEIDAQNILIAAQGDLQLQGASVNTITVNQKDIVTGQKMNFGAGEETSMQFDPRAQVNIVTPGSINMKAAQDYKLGTLGCISIFAVGGPGALVKNRTVGASVSTKTTFAAGGNIASDIVSSGFTKIQGTGGVEITTPAMLDMAGTTDVILSSEGMLDVVATDINIGAEDSATTTVQGINTTVKGTTTTVEGTTQAELKSSGGSIKVIGTMIYLN